MVKLARRSFQITHQGGVYIAGDRELMLLLEILDGLSRLSSQNTIGRSGVETKSG